MSRRDPSTLIATVLANGRCFVQKIGRTATVRTRQNVDSVDFEAAMEDVGLAIRRMIVAGQDWADRGHDERQRTLDRLRDAGFDLLTTIAHEDNRVGFVEALRNTRYMQVAGERNIPWEFLYLGSRDKPASLENFFGAQAVVGHPIDRQDVPKLGAANSLRQDSVFARRPAGQPLISGLAEDLTLDSAKSAAEAAVLTNRGLAPIRLGPLHPPRRAALDTFGSFLNEATDLVHFNCHAIAGSRVRPSAISVTDSFTINETEIADLSIEIDAVVVLNCCHGIALRRDTRDTVATAFAGRGVRAVVGPTNEVADDYATVWADHFYGAFLSGQPVGAAILSARQALFTAPGANPMALLYAFVGEYDASLEEERAA